MPRRRRTRPDHPASRGEHPARDAKNPTGGTTLARPREKTEPIDPDYADDINKDLDDIIDGKVPKTGDTWTVNGRTYGQHDGALHPQSGPGIVDLNRMQHQLVKQMNTDPVNGQKFADALPTDGNLIAGHGEITRKGHPDF